MIRAFCALVIALVALGACSSKKYDTVAGANQATLNMKRNATAAQIDAIRELLLHDSNVKLFAVLAMNVAFDGTKPIFPDGPLGTEPPWAKARVIITIRAGVNPKVHIQRYARMPGVASVTFGAVYP